MESPEHMAHSMPCAIQSIMSIMSIMSIYTAPTLCIAPCALPTNPYPPSAAVRHALYLLPAKEWLFFVFPVLYYIFNG